MFKVITEAQKMEIEELSKDHFDALIAYGGDLYRQGFIEGSIKGVICFVGGYAIAAGCDKLWQRHKAKKK